MIDPIENRDLPITKTPDGGWQYNALVDRELLWGVVFEPSAGYVVYLKYVESTQASLMTVSMAWKTSNDLRAKFACVHKEIIPLCAGIEQAAASAETLNNRWVALGCPPRPLDMIGEVGNA
jgi:hypothetical protein